MLAKNHIHPDRTCFSKCSFCSIRFGLLDVPFHGHEFRSDSMKEYLTSCHHKLDDCMCEYCKGCFKKRYDDEQNERLKNSKLVSLCEMDNCIKKSRETIQLTSMIKARMKKEGTSVSSVAKVMQVCRSHHVKLKGQKCVVCSKFFEPVPKRTPTKYDIKEYNTEIAKEKPGISIELESDMCRICQMVLTQKITKLKKAKVMKSLAVSRVGRRIEKNRPKAIKTRSQLTGRQESTQSQKNPAAHSSRSCNKECQLCYIKFGEYDIPMHATEYQEVGLQQHYKDTYKKPMDLCLCRKCFTKIGSQYKSGNSTDSGTPESLCKIRKPKCFYKECKEAAHRYIRVKPQLLQVLQQGSAAWESKVEKSPGNKPQRVNLCEEHFSSFKLILLSQQKCHICNTALYHNSLFAPFRRSNMVAGKMAAHVNTLLKLDGRPERIMKDSKLCRHCYMYWKRRSKGAGMPSPVNKYPMHKRYSFSYEENDLPLPGSDSPPEGLLPPDEIKQEPNAMIAMQNRTDRFSSHVTSRMLPRRSATIREMSLNIETKMKFYAYVRDYPSESKFIEHLLSLEDERRRRLNLDVYTGIKTEIECQSSFKFGNGHRDMEADDLKYTSQLENCEKTSKSKPSKDMPRIGVYTKSKACKSSSAPGKLKKRLPVKQCSKVPKPGKQDQSLTKPRKCNKSVTKSEKRYNVKPEHNVDVSKTKGDIKTDSVDGIVLSEIEGDSFISEDLNKANDSTMGRDSSNASKSEVCNKVSNSMVSSNASKSEVCNKVSNFMVSSNASKFEVCNKVSNSMVSSNVSKSEVCNKVSNSMVSSNVSKSEVCTKVSNFMVSNKASKSEVSKKEFKSGGSNKTSRPRVSNKAFRSKLSNNAFRSGVLNKASKTGVSKKVSRSVLCSKVTSRDCNDSSMSGDQDKSLISRDGDKILESGDLYGPSQSKDCNEVAKKFGDIKDSPNSADIINSAKCKGSRKIIKPIISNTSQVKRKTKISNSRICSNLSKIDGCVDSSKLENCKVERKTSETEEGSETPSRRRERRAAKKVTNYTENDEVFESFFLSAENNYGPWFELEESLQEEKDQSKEEDQEEASPEKIHSAMKSREVTKKLFSDDDVSPQDPSIIKLKR